MIDDRNLSSHVYSEEVSTEIYKRIRTNAHALRDLYERLSTTPR